MAGYKLNGHSLSRRLDALPILGLSLIWLVAGTSAAQAAAAAVLPTGGKVAAGSAVIGAPAGGALTIDQTSARAIIDWSSFSIGAAGRVQFDNGSGATLNRVTGSGGSAIDGLLGATGSVYLINPSGVIIGRNGVVKVGGSFVASTLGAADGQFLAGGSLTFFESGPAAVVNYGRIGALGGDVALIAARVVNDGTIDAARGDAGLLAGYRVTLRDRALDDGKFAVLLGGPATSATNAGIIEAADAELRANGGNVYALAGNTGGLIKATGVTTSDGKVFLVADGGATIAHGQIDATRANGAGGSVETSGTTVDFTGLRVKAASWLVDPYDLTVGAAAAFTIDTNLATTSVTLQTTATSASGPGVVNKSGAGDITIAAPISWSSANTLTLDAYHGVNILAPVTASGAGKVALITNDGGSGGDCSFGLGPSGFAGSLSFTGAAGSGQGLTINGAAYTLVYSMAEVQNINASDAALQGNYALAMSLDGSSTSGWVPIGTDGKGDVGNSGKGFSGAFDGLGHTISNLTVAIGSNSYSGPFGYSSGDVRDIGMIGGSISGGVETGGLVAANKGMVDNAYTTGAVTGKFDVGGLAGYSSGAITNAFASGAVTGGGGRISSYIGGLTGYSTGTISDAYATGSVSGTVLNLTAYVGGLAGYSTGSISDAYATGSVSAGVAIGGLVGEDGGSITDAFATGSVHGAQGGAEAGGLVGWFVPGGSITDAYATGVVGGGAYAYGGLVGYTGEGGTIVTNGYWDTRTSSQSTSAGGVGRTTAQLQGALPAGFSSSVWGTGPGLYPYLLSEYPASGGAPQAVSGIASAGGKALSWTSVALLINGVAQGTVTSGDNGYYYFLTAPGTISSSGSDLALYLPGATKGATSFYEAVGTLGGTTLTGGELEVTSAAATQSALVASLDQAVGAAPDSGLLYTQAGGFAKGIAVLMTLTAPTFDLDEHLDLGSGALTIDAAGSLSEAGGGVITAASLSGSSAGPVEFRSSRNRFATLAGFTTNGGGYLHLADADDLTVTGLVDAGSGILTLKDAGTITESGAGALDAVYLRGEASGDVSLGGANMVHYLSIFTHAGGGDFSLNDGEGLVVARNEVLDVTGGALSLTTTSGPLYVRGLLTADTLTLASAANAWETDTGNIQASLLNVTAQTGIVLLSPLNTIAAIGVDTTTTGRNEIKQ